MELYPLRVFLTVATERSFSRAGEKLLRTQPAISIAIQRLESDLKEKLIDRSGRELLLTDAGRVVLEYARRFQNLESDLENALRELRDNYSGRLTIGANESTSLYLIQHIERYRRLFPKVKVQVRRSLSSKIPSNLLDPDDAVVDPRGVMAALRVACERAGVTIAERHAVHRIEQVSARQIRVWNGAGGNDFRAAVLAAGAWSGSIETSGMPPIPASEPVKGHLIGYQMPHKCCQTIVRHDLTHTYILQRVNGFLIAGSNMEHAGFDRSIQNQVVKQLETNAAFVLPHLAETSPTEVWTGFRPGSDRLHIGRWQESPLYLAYGHLRNGLLLAPVTAERIADQMAEAFF